MCVTSEGAVCVCKRLCKGQGDLIIDSVMYVRGPSQKTPRVVPREGGQADREQLVQHTERQREAKWSNRVQTWQQVL